MRSSPRTIRTRPRQRRGFTLIESAMVTVIIGVGVVAMIELLASGSIANGESRKLTTAIHLAGNIREAMLRQDYAGVWAMEGDYGTAGGVSASPVDSRLQPVADMGGWVQTVDVQSVDPNRITLVVPDDPGIRTARVTVSISRHGRVVYTASWLVTNAS